MSRLKSAVNQNHELNFDLLFVKLARLAEWGLDHDVIGTTGSYKLRRFVRD